MINSIEVRLALLTLILAVIINIMLPDSPLLQPKFNVGDCFIDGMSDERLEVVYKITKVDIDNQRYDIDWYWRNRGDKFKVIKSIAKFIYDEHRESKRTKCPENNEVYNE